MSKHLQDLYSTSTVADSSFTKLNLKGILGRKNSRSFRIFEDVP